MNASYVNEAINDLQDYMFTTTNANVNKYIITTKPTSQSKIPYNNKRTNVKADAKATTSPNAKTCFTPKQRDSLFWCFYILKYGLFNYEMEIAGKYFSVEKEQKYKYVELLRQNKELLKLHKLKPFTEIESNLANDACISIKTFFALCAIEHFNVLLVYKRKFYQMQCTDTTDFKVVCANVSTSSFASYRVEFEPTMNDYRDNYLRIDGYDDTLKSISSYKVDDLLELCKKLHINIDMCKQELNKQKLTKNEIYDYLSRHY